MSDEAGLALRWLTVLLVGFVLQIGVLADVQPFGVHADLMLLMGICAGLAGGPTRGAVIGFAAGLLVDAVMPGTLGISALSYSVVGFTVGSFRESVMSSTRSMDMLVAAAGSAAGADGGAGGGEGGVGVVGDDVARRLAHALSISITATLMVLRHKRCGLRPRPCNTVAGAVVIDSDMGGTGIIGRTRRYIDFGMPCSGRQAST